MSLLPSMLNLVLTWRWSGYRGVFENWGVSGCLYYFCTKTCSEMTSGGDLCHAGTRKLICETNL